MKTLLVKTHEAWLTTLMAAFMSSETENKRILTEFSDILWRHFTWIENDLIKEGIDYDYNRDNIPIKVDRLSVIVADIIRRMNDLELLLVRCGDEALKNRIATDLSYMKYALGKLED